MKLVARIALLRRSMCVYTGVVAVAISIAAPVPMRALTCAESGAQVGVVESVLNGSHPRATRWKIIASGTVLDVRPVGGNYDMSGADVTLAVDAWFRGGNSEPVLEFFDPPRAVSGVGFETGRSYLVFASDDLNWDGRLATGLCELTFEISAARRAELVATFHPVVPNTALLPPGTPWAAIGWVSLGASIVLVVRRWRMAEDAEKGNAPGRC